MHVNPNFLLFFFRFTNNILSSAQQVWLKKLGGAKPVVSQDGGGIISAGRAIRSDRGDRYY
jgi:YidC/Oxa1 family membrane protein insertase